MTFRTLLLATALLTVTATFAAAQGTGQGTGQDAGDAVAAPVLRANVNVTSDLVRIGDVIDNAGVAASIAIYRAPDLGTTGSLPTSQIITALRAHQVIGVDTRDIKEVAVTRLSRTVEAKEIERAVASALEHRSGLGDAANLSLTFDRDVQEIRLDAANSGVMQPVAARVEPRSGRFDVTFEIANTNGGASTKMRFTGTAIETLEVAVLTRNVDRADLLRSADVVVERRPKTEIGGEPASRSKAIGMQLRRPMRAQQALKAADLVKPDLVQRDQEVTLIHQSAGLYLTTRGKALDNGTEGDIVNVMNPQSKRTISGTVTGRGQVTIEIATPRAVAAVDTTASIAPEEPAAPVSPGAARSSVTPKPE
jgi:flagella basal body P-ring formation protein FlgA